VEEMLVADLTSVDSSDATNNHRRVQVPPRERPAFPGNPASAIASSSSPAYNGYNSMLGKALPKFSVQAQRVLDQLISGPYSPHSSSDIVPAPQSSTGLALLETRLRQQAQEIQDAKLQLAQRDAEISRLNAESAEKEVRLRSARVELMEARASAQERELKLREVYSKLAEAGLERARLREELGQTRMELADTQADLEALADEILVMKDLVLSQEELDELGAASESLQSSGTNQSGHLMASTGAEDMAAAAAQGTWQVLQSLAALSRQVMNDAIQDDDAFSGSGLFGGLSQTMSDLGLKRGRGGSKEGN